MVAPRFLFEEVERLAAAQRLELAETIGDTVAEDAGADVLPVSEAHRQELDLHLAELEANPDAGSSCPEVRSRLDRSR